MLIFQYGSNTSAARLNGEDRLRGDAVDLGLARTRDNYEPAFTVWSKSNNCAAADLRADGNSPAWGVLYDIPDSLVLKGGMPGRKSLDGIEGIGYKRRPIQVVMANGSVQPREVYTYTVRAPEAGLATNLEYASHILIGLYEHDAPGAYIERVKQLVAANNPALRHAMERFTFDS